MYQFAILAFGGLAVWLVGKLLAQHGPDMARASSLETRLRAILEPTIRRRAVTLRVVGAGAVAALLVLAPLAALHLHGQGAAGLAGDSEQAFRVEQVDRSRASVVQRDSRQGRADGGRRIQERRRGRRCGAARRGE